jgi:hypothetical protein
MPSYVTRARVAAAARSSCQNFIVRISTQAISLIDVIIGSCSIADSRRPVQRHVRDQQCRNRLDRKFDR